MSRDRVTGRFLFKANQRSNFLLFGLIPSDPRLYLFVRRALECSLLEEAGGRRLEDALEGVRVVSAPRESGREQGGKRPAFVAAKKPGGKLSRLGMLRREVFCHSRDSDRGKRRLVGKQVMKRRGIGAQKGIGCVIAIGLYRERPSLD